MAIKKLITTLVNALLSIRLPLLSNQVKVLISTVIGVIIIGIFTAVTYGNDVPVLQTHGLIANQERDIMYIILGLALVVVVPTFIMLFSIAWKYRASNTKANYEPDFESSIKLEALWWGIPCLIILILAFITSYATHVLDPYKPIESGIKPVNVQVVSLEWKWLFIYPDEGIATVNYMNIPKNTPVNLTITSDAPMNSFWVPALAGQIYSMSGMSTQLHLMADGEGSYKGVSANLSGKGFADMNFVVNSQSSSQFTRWVNNTKATGSPLAKSDYDTLAKPSTEIPINSYALKDNNLYNEIIMKYMPEGTTMGSMKHEMDME